MDKGTCIYWNFKLRKLVKDRDEKKETYKSYMFIFFIIQIQTKMFQVPKSVMRDLMD